MDGRQANGRAAGRIRGALEENRRYTRPGMYWNHLNAVARRRPPQVDKARTDFRTPFESDYDRVLFSSSFRRLQDKTQVFPLERHDFVRTRLTHSLEVSTVGRNLGISVAKALINGDHERSVNAEDFGTIVATACLLHDIGNPPFGHSGEKSIGRWFKDHGEALKITDTQERLDLECFEGNASGFRIATRLQHLGDEFGLNLTAGTLACLMKYPCASTEMVKGSKRRAKFGYYKADQATFAWVQEQTRLAGARHPLAFLMEAADDIVYSAVDIEDALKKGILDYQTIVAFLADSLKECPAGRQLVADHLEGRLSYLIDKGYSTGEARQLAFQYFRTIAVGKMAGSCVEHFVACYPALMEGSHDQALTEDTGAAKGMKLAPLCKAMQDLAVAYVYSNREIVAIEFAGRRILHGLLDIFQEELNDWKAGKSKLIKSLLPPEVRNSADEEIAVSESYRYMLRAADYIAGMTDSYARDLHHRLTGIE